MVRSIYAAKMKLAEAGQLGLIPTRLLSQLGPVSFLLVLIFDYPFFSAHQEPGIKAHMLNRVSFHPITRAKRPQAF